MSEQTTVKTLTAVTNANDNRAAVKVQEPVTAALVQGVRESLLTSSSSTRALQEILAEIQAIPADKVRKLPVLVPQAVAAGRHYARRYAEDRAAFVQALNPCVFAPADYDNLDVRSEALWEADVLFGKILESNNDASKAAEEARRVKYRLVRTAEYLWGDDKEKMDAVNNAKSGYSHLDLADSIFTLYHLFIDNLDDVKQRSDVTEAELEQAHDLGNSLLDAIGPSRDEKLNAAQSLRDRTGEYLRRGIDGIRTAAGFIFRDDEERLSRYPTLGSLRKKPRTSADDDEATVEETTPEEISEVTAPEVETVPTVSDSPVPAV